jgi:hypothetical protein
VYAFEGKVVGPSITPRVKERRQFPSLRVDSSQVRAFVQIAALASKRQIIIIIGAAVYSCGDVFDMMPQATMFLEQTTIFTPLASSLPDKVPRRRIHLLLNIRVEV